MTAILELNLESRYRSHLILTQSRQLRNSLLLNVKNINISYIILVDEFIKVDFLATDPTLTNSNSGSERLTLFSVN